MRQFLAFKSTPAYGEHKTQDAGVVGTELATVNPNDLADGAVGVYAIANDGKLKLIQAAADLLDVKKITVFRGTATGAIASDEILRSTLAVEKQAYVASTAKVVTVASIPANLAAGVTVTVQVTNNSSTIGHEWKFKNYEYTTVAANETAANIATELAAKINAKSDAVVTASVSTNDLVLTAKSTTKNFTVALEGLTGATVTVSTQPVRSEGSSTQLKELQKEIIGHEGKTNFIDRTTGDVGDYNLVEDGVNYVVYNVAWVGKVQRVAVPTATEASRFLRLYLAIPTGAGSITTLDTVLGLVAQQEIAAQAEEAGA